MKHGRGATVAAAADEAAGGSPPPESRSDLTILHHGVDVLLRLSLIVPVLSHHLFDEVVPALERAELLFGELAPLGADVLEQDLSVFGRIFGVCLADILVCGVHERISIKLM